MHRSWLLVGAVVLLAVAAGCVGVGDGGGGGSGTADWCSSGAYEAVATQQAGGSVTVESQGTVERDGRQLCHVSYEIEDESSQYARLDAFFDERQEYVEFVYYDAEGNEIGRMDYTGSTDGGSADDGGANDGTAGPGGAASWCPVGQTASVSDSQAGSGMTFVVEERFERDGMELCRSSYEFTGEDTEYSRIDFVFNEEETFQQLVYYDEDGNVLEEVTVADDT